MKFQIRNFINHLATASEADIQTLVSWIQHKTPVAINAFNTAYNISQTLIAEAQSPTGLAAEALVDRFVPQTAAVFPVVLELVQKAGIACKAVAGDIPAIEGIALRYAGEIVSAIEGKKQTIGDYILEVQKMFTGSAAAVA